MLFTFIRPLGNNKNLQAQVIIHSYSPHNHKPSNIISTTTTTATKFPLPPSTPFPLTHFPTPYPIDQQTRKKAPSTNTSHHFLFFFMSTKDLQLPPPLHPSLPPITAPQPLQLPLQPNTTAAASPSLPPVPCTATSDPSITAACPLRPSQTTLPRVMNHLHHDAAPRKHPPATSTRTTHIHRRHLSRGRKGRNTQGRRRRRWWQTGRGGRGGKG